MAEEIDFENCHFETLSLTWCDPDLGWPWKSYHRECLIDPNKYHYLICGCVEFVDVRTDGRTYGQTDAFTGFIGSSLRWPKNREGEFFTPWGPGMWSKLFLAIGSEKEYPKQV